MRVPLYASVLMRNGPEQPVAGIGDQELRDLSARVIEAESRAVLRAAAAIDDTFVAVVRLLTACAGKIVVVGSGTSGAIAARAAHLFSVGGTPAFRLSPSDGLHGGLGVLRRDDVVIALSKGGGSTELNEFCRLARPLCGGLVALTSRRDSPLASLVDHVILLPSTSDDDLGGVVATGSSLATASVLDALVEAGRLARDYSWEQLLYTHPAGAVGQEAAQTLRRLEGVSESTP